MKKIKYLILWIFSLLFITPAFAIVSFSPSIVNHSWKDYFCFVETMTVTTGRNSTWPSYTSSQDYYTTPIRCGWFSDYITFSYYFNLFPEMSGKVWNVPIGSQSYYRFYNKSLNFVVGPGYTAISPVFSTPLYTASFNSVSKTNLTFQNSILFSNYSLLKINYSNSSFFDFTLNELQWNFYNKPFFTWVTYWNNNWLSMYYLPGMSLSSVYQSWSSYLFKTIFDDWYTLNDNWKIISFNTNVNDVLLVPLLDYWYNYLTWSKTLLLKLYDWNLIYNLLDCYSSKSDVLSSCSVIDKWYFNDYVSFLSLSWYNPFFESSYTLNFLNNKTNYSLNYYNNWVINSFIFGRLSNANSSDISFYYSGFDSLFGLTKSFNLLSDSSVIDIWPTIKFNLTFHEAQDVLDTLCNSSLLKPAFCNRIDEVSTWVDWFWDLDWSWNLVYTLINTDSDDMWWATITPNWSWWFNITCSSDWGFLCPIIQNSWSDLLSDYWSWVLLDTWYYENFFQKTWYFFRCPYEYIVLDTWSFLRILNKFNDISSSIGFDFMLPINCTISAFVHGKQFKFLSDVDLWLDPLMWYIQGPDDPRIYLYRFFDFLLSFALLCFLLKLYHLIN